MGSEAEIYDGEGGPEPSADTWRIDAQYIHRANSVNNIGPHLDLSMNFAKVVLSTLPPRGADLSTWLDSRTPADFC